MSLPRAFLAGEPDGGVLPLSTSDRHHFRDVLRLGAGDAVVVVDPSGVEYRVRIGSFVEHGVVADRMETAPTPAEEGHPVPEVWLVQGLAKGSRLDDVVRAATEIGVTGVAPFTSERTVVRLDGPKASRRAERWRRIATEASKQSRRNAPLRVLEPMPLAEAVTASGAEGLVVLWEEHEGRGLGEAVDAVGRPLAVAVGPEGGLSSDEVRMLEGMGGVTCGLGRTILRTETAGPIAAALALYELGGLGGSAP